MEAQNRGRSPSVGHQPDQRIRSSLSPHGFNGSSDNRAFTPPSYRNNNLPPTATSNLNFDPSGSYFHPGAQQPHFSHAQHVLPNNDFNDQSFRQAFQPNGLTSNDQQAPAQMHVQHSDQSFQTEMLNLDTNFGGVSQLPNISGKQDQFSNHSFILDPQLQENMQQQNQSINPADIMSTMSSPQNLAPTPPNLLPLNAQQSEPASPFNNQSEQWSPNHSRHTSLDPSAAYSNGQQQDWSGMLQGLQFRGHRRAQSEHSDVSSSVAPSPFVSQSDTFEPSEQNPSPLLNPQQDNQLFQEGLRIENFTLSDDPPSRHSPRHTPFISPRMSPEPGMAVAQDTSFMALPEPQQDFNGVLGPESYADNEQFPTLPPEQRVPSNDYGQADQYDVPQISVQPAPATRQPAPDNTRYPADMGALSPPEQRRNGRNRAKSDTFISRPASPSSTQSTLGSSDSSLCHRNDSLSPFNFGSISPNGSRSTSPAPRSPSQRRSSTSSVPNNRDYVLELADPNRPPAPGTDKRIQKHPATFACHLCPKKFTRAYNLRSHLRTHTDERPFVCTVCNKAFARQHDRKRHEGLHSGEKKFVCRGELSTGSSWGCGRRFARADALGRHFRSEAGRVCIKPLLDEEFMERQRLDEQMMGQRLAQGGIAPQASINGMAVQQQHFSFPAALLQQFPALQGLQWEQMQGPPDEEELSGRSSFDASSGAEFYDEEDGGSGYVSDNPMSGGYGNAGGWQNDHGWKSDVKA